MRAVRRNAAASSSAGASAQVQGCRPRRRAHPRRSGRARGGRAPERGRVRVRRLGLQPLQAALLLGGGGGPRLRCGGRLLRRAARLADLPGRRA